MTPSGLSCHLAASTQCQESDSYCHTGAPKHTHTHTRTFTHTPEDCRETPSMGHNFTGNYILKINI